MVTQGSAGNGGDVVVGIKVLSAQALKELDKVKASVKTMGTNMRLPGFESPGKLKEMSNVLLANQKNMTNFWDNYMSSVKGAKRITEDLGKSTKKFSMWALGVMFFGQALKRVFGSIAKSGIRVFQDVMHSVQGTVTNFDLLKGSLLFLSFSIGQALEPMIRFLIPIIDTVSEWVSENQGLTAGIIATGFALGVVFGVGGAAVLAIESLGEMTEAIATLKTDLKGLDFGKLGGLAAIGISFFMAKDALDDFAKGEFTRGFLKMVGAAVTSIGGLMLFAGNPVGGALIGIGVTLYLVSTGKFFTAVGKFLTVASALILSGFEVIGTEAADALRAPIERVLNHVATVLSNMGLTTLADDLTEFATKIGSGSSAISFEDAFAKNYAYFDKQFGAGGRTMDEAINSFMSYIDSLVGEAELKQVLDPNNENVTPTDVLDIIDKLGQKEPTIIQVLVDGDVISEKILEPVNSQINRTS